MSRNNKQRRREKQLKQRRKGSQTRGTATSRWRDVCYRAAGLIKHDGFDQARELLEDYDKAHPGQSAVLNLLLEVYQEQNDYGPYCAVCRRLIERDPDNPHWRVMLAGGYMCTARPASALKAFHSFLKRWPNDPLAEGARQTVNEIEPGVLELLRDMPFAGDERIDFATQHEEMLASLEAGEYERVIFLGEQLLKRCPEFVPAMNNLSEVYFLTGRTNDAIVMSRRALQLEPTNFYAVGNLTKHLFLTGQTAEAKALAEQLRSVQSDRDDIWCKKCEALSYLGDDEGVLAVFAEAEKTGVIDEPLPTNALLYHLAAVASARQGDLTRAKKLWRKALKIAPDMDLASENLADAALPAAERHGPWYFSMEYWIRRDEIGELMKSMSDAANRKNDEAVTQSVRRFADAHPNIVHIVPALLDRGDRAGREFAWRFAFMLETPEMLDALRTFCLSQRGPDTMRLETANRLSSLDAMPAGTVRLWLEGAWKESELVGFQISGEPLETNRSEQVNDWVYKAFQALHRHDGVTAERYLRKCIDADGEAPDLLNNLGAAYELQGLTDEAQALIKQIHERWPDYFFGRIAMARQAMEDDSYELAESYLAPLRKLKKLHTTEFSALAQAYIRLFLLQGKLEPAQRWLEMWRQIEPDHPQLKQIERRLNPISLLKKFRDAIPLRRRKKTRGDET